ncbi:hypothetical protein BIV57_21595 [Mangrovactinospora gilvigrisea]|uniref:Uncharacterized protein n=1 Tax=Mangrovactinospora gilvigrisea TaxID=1428644 RepID=A0A1J7C707_9ACTN|nr:hypothetical protein [Mangrovactinospora gilvigrisea]OIV35426.1 hypothetical protein BIV57_21595 [Mangrovactinospora gilvigrisea]
MPNTAHSALFTTLFDDAALFPPGNAPMDSAVRAHEALLGREDTVELVGPFVCRSARIPELVGALAGLTPPPDGFFLSLVARGGRDELLAALAAADAPPLVVGAVELANPDTAAAVAALDELLPKEAAGFVELPWRSLEAGLDALAASTSPDGLRAKFRTGGTDASAFPTEAQLAGAIAGAVRRGLAFKCTAGLHHAVRRADPETGFEHHGFLNVILATAAALDDPSDTAAVAAALAERDPQAVAERIRALDGPRAAAVRGRFTSFGTCSIDEPVCDLVDLGLLALAME